jgi:hypothetical protein
MREVLPIVGATVGGYFAGAPANRLSWWRRALLRFGKACIRVANPPTYWMGSHLAGEPVDPERNGIGGR